MTDKYIPKDLICVNCGETEPTYTQYKEEIGLSKGTPWTIEELNKLVCHKCACKGYIRTRFMVGAISSEESGGDGFVAGVILVGLLY